MVVRVGVLRQEIGKSHLRPPEWNDGNGPGKNGNKAKSDAIW